MKIPVFKLVLIIFLTSVSSTAVSLPPPSQENRENLTKFAKQIFKHKSLPDFQIGAAKTDVVESFGLPESATIVVKRDYREPELFIEETSWLYDGLIFAFYSPLIRMYPSSWIQSIEVSSSEYKLALGLDIGTHRDSYLSTFGRPWEILGDTYQYGIGYEATIDGRYHSVGLSIEITFDSDDRSKQVKWTYVPTH